MADIDLRVRVNKQARMTFTRGEDRMFEVLLSDGNTCLPVDLFGAQLTFSFPREGGGVVKRRSAPLAFNWDSAVTLNNLSVIEAPSHGLVYGDPLILASTVDGVDLPAPFVAGTTYFAVPYSNDSFGLADPLGTYLQLQAPASGTATAASQDFLIGNTAQGLAYLKLSAAATNEISTGQGLAYQLTLRTPDALTRIYAANTMLDVFPQPCP